MKLMNFVRLSKDQTNSLTYTQHTKEHKRECVLCVGMTIFPRLA